MEAAKSKVFGAAYYITSGTSVDSIASRYMKSQDASWFPVVDIRKALGYSKLQLKF
jgi:hypothetical protein